MNIHRALAFFRQPDVRRAPCRAVWRRLRWHSHWWRPGAKPLRLRKWWRGVEIELPASGSAARAYYEDMSEHAVVCAMERCLRPGMTVLDVGAHVGAYSLVAAKLVGPSGQVWAIEPQPELAEAIQRNAMLNGMTWLHVAVCALGVETGVAAFRAEPRTKGGGIVSAGAGTFEVPVATLDDFCARHARPAFIKLDAAGHELAVLQGGANILSAADAPDLIVKFYHRDELRRRYGIEGDEQRAWLVRRGYHLHEWTGSRWTSFAREVTEYGVAILATRARIE